MWHAIGLAVLPDHARESPQVRRDVAVLRREQEADQVRPERPRRVLQLLLDHGGLASQQLDAARRRRSSFDERGIDRDHLGPRPRLDGERHERLARLLAVRRPGERSEQILHRALRIVDPLVDDARASQMQIDALGGQRRRERDIHRVDHGAPRHALVELRREPLDLGEEARVARRDGQRLGEHGQGARLVTEPSLEDPRELARERHEPLGLDGSRRDARAAIDRTGPTARLQPLALVGEDLGELAPQVVRLRRAPDVGERLLVGRLVVRAPPPAKGALRIGELVGGGRGDPLHERAPRLCPVVGIRVVASRQQREHPLDRLHVLLPLAQPREQLGGRRERLFLIRIELEDALVRLQRPRRIAEAVTADHPDLETARDLPVRLGRQVHLALRDPHRRVEVAAGLVQPPQRGVRVEVIRIELADELVEHLDRLGGRAELRLEQVRALDSGHARALAVLSGRAGAERGEHGDLAAERIGELAPLAGCAVQPHERRERRPALRRQLEEPVPRFECPGGVAEVRVEHGRVALEVVRAHRRLGCPRRGQRLAAIEPLEDLREVGPALGALVQLAQGREGLGIRGRRAQRVLPAIERHEVVAALRRELREPLQELRALGGGARGGRVILERLLEARIAGLLEHALHALERIAIAGEQLQHRARRVDHAIDIREPRLVQDREPAQLRQPLGALRDRVLLRRIRPTAAIGRGLGRAGSLHRRHELRLVEVEHPPQRPREAGVVAFLLVELGERLQRALVLRAAREHLLVDLDRAPRIDLPLAIRLRHLLEAGVALHRVGCRRDLALEPGDELLPHLAARRQPAQRLGDLGTSRLLLRDALPRIEGARDVTEPQLRELRDLLEPAHEVVGGRVRLARVVERKLVEIDEPAPVAPLAEVIDVPRERLLVRRVDAERLVQQLRRAIAIAHVLARDRRELEDLRHEHARGRARILTERVDLGLDEPRQRLPVLVVLQQLAQLSRRLRARHVVRDELREHLDQARPVRQLVAIQRGAPS